MTDRFPAPSPQGLAQYRLRVLDTPFANEGANENAAGLTAAHWNRLLAAQADANPFMRYEYLAALYHSGSATARTGWSPHCVSLWQGDVLHAACMLYVKPHSYGEYVFDWAWANAYAQHGLDYYPKAVVAVPFTPVPGARLLARDAHAREALALALVQWCEAKGMSSLHLLFGNEADIQACAATGMMLRNTVQFHWQNAAPTPAAALPPEGGHLSLGRPGGQISKSFMDFDDFLGHLAQDKRKKIRQERRKVAEAGVQFRHALGAEISQKDWDFFYRCYERTYLEHGNSPYLSRNFFTRMAQTMPESWLLFIAERAGQPIASSLIAVNEDSTCATAENASNSGKVAYGRYWGALERVDCLHFEACYYQPLQWCIAQGYRRFEGGAQGEHKMARALLPVKTASAHWLAHPSFANAVQNFLEREGQGIDNYMTELEGRSPLRQT